MGGWGGAMKKEGGPPAWSGPGSDGWAGLPGARRAQRLLLLADALAPGWGCAASFLGLREQQAAAAPRWSGAGGLRPRNWRLEVGVQVGAWRFGTRVRALSCTGKRWILRGSVFKSVSSGSCLGSHSSWKGPCAFEFLRFGAGPGLFNTYICFKKINSPTFRRDIQGKR